MVTVHRELIRNLQHWRALYESRQVPEILVAGDGKEYCLWDVEKFYAARHTLPDRQQRTIRMNLFEDRSEREIAELLGIGRNNPVAIYGTVGLTRLLAAAVKGQVEGYFVPLPADCSAVTGVYTPDPSSRARRSPAPTPTPTTTVRASPTSVTVTRTHPTRTTHREEVETTREVLVVTDRQSRIRRVS